mgnify:CR=1 FL=1
MVFRCTAPFMLKTYALFLRGDGDKPQQFQAVTCKTNAEALQSARALLASHPECQAVDIFFGDTELFRVKQESNR